MAIAKTAEKNKMRCHDCKKEIEVLGEEIKNGFELVYEDGGEKIAVLKCGDCYKKRPGLTNYKACEVYSRIVGYLRPVQQWNKGKEQEYADRKEYKMA